jgi:hypothetical protein
MRRWCLLCNVVLLTAFSPAFAKGRHVSCHFHGLVNNGTTSKSIERTLNFYLDDTSEQLVGEGGDVSKGTNLNARTTLYSDVEVHAEISTGLVPTVMFFGRVTKAPAQVQINRVTGSAALIANFHPRGSDIEIGSCSETAPPPTKF